MTTLKFSFILRTQQDTGRISEKVLASTNSRDRSTVLQRRFLSSIGEDFSDLRMRKKVRVLSVNYTEFSKYVNSLISPRPGDGYSSVHAFAEAIKANPSTVRVTLAKAIREGKPAIIRGVTYAYAT